MTLVEAEDSVVWEKGAPRKRRAIHFFGELYVGFITGCKVSNGVPSIHSLCALRMKFVLCPQVVIQLTLFSLCLNWVLYNFSIYRLWNEIMVILQLRSFNGGYVTLNSHAYDP